MKTQKLARRILFFENKPYQTNLILWWKHILGDRGERAKYNYVAFD